MKLTCDRATLNDKLSLAIRAVPSRPTHPVLANFQLLADATNQVVHLVAFDLSLGIRVSFGAVVDEGGEIAVPAKLLNDIVSRLPDGPISLENEPDGTLVHLTCLTGNYELRGMSADDFPALPEIEGGQKIEIAAETLTEGLRGALFAASNDETKQVLVGVRISMGQDGLEFAATDGHRLAVVETMDNSDPLASGGVTVPATTLRELERALVKLSNDKVIKLCLDDTQIIFELGDQQITSRVLDGAYPDYRQLLPKDFATEVTVDRRTLIGALERIAVIADRKNNIVKFTIKEISKSLDLSVDAADVGSGKESVSIDLKGDGLLIAFNVTYMLESLKNLPSNEVQLHFNTPTSPTIITPLGGTKITHLVMPVQIRD